LAIGFGNAIRMVTHCDVSRNDIDSTVSSIRTLV
jgi:threonine aldolase